MWSGHLKDEQVNYANWSHEVRLVSCRQLLTPSRMMIYGGPPSPTESSKVDETGTAIGDSLSERRLRNAENIGGNRDRVFELRDISVKFASGGCRCKDYSMAISQGNEGYKNINHSSILMLTMI